jgi:hypothetical protein
MRAAWWLSELLSTSITYLPMVTLQNRRAADRPFWAKLGMALFVPIVSGVAAAFASTYVTGKVLEERLQGLKDRIEGVSYEATINRQQIREHELWVRQHIESGGHIRPDINGRGGSFK